MDLAFERSDEASSAVARLSAAALSISSNNHDRLGAEILVDPRSPTTLTPTPFRVARIPLQRFDPLSCLVGLPPPPGLEGP